MCWFVLVCSNEWVDLQKKKHNLGVGAHGKVYIGRITEAGAASSAVLCRQVGPKFSFVLSSDVCCFALLICHQKECCAVLCRVVLCCAVLCCSVLCCPVPCCAVLCHIVLCCARASLGIVSFRVQLMYPGPPSGMVLLGRGRGGREKDQEDWP